MLDEATAALDTETEPHIQDALTTLGHGRTMLIIAHRLSTITLADQILVLHEGQVVERGSHEDLLAKKGRYANMWKRQIQAEKAAKQARASLNRAERLKAGDSSPDQSGDEHLHHINGFGHSRGASSSSNLAFGTNVGEKPAGHP